MLLRINPDNIDSKILTSVANVALAGDMIVFPTDTIYGIGTSAHSQAGVMRLFAIKKRPVNSPVGIFVDSYQMLERYCDFTGEIRNFLETIWPGPITCIMKRAQEAGIYTTPTKTQIPTVAARIPKNPVTAKLVSIMGEALLETSVNVSTQPFLKWDELLGSYTNFAQMMVSSGAETDQNPSTIIDLSGEKVKLVREGSFGWNELKTILKRSGLSADEN
jgi:L-threonylcarbamoyladenylate synthase